MESPWSSDEHEVGALDALVSSVTDNEDQSSGMVGVPAGFFLSATIDFSRVFTREFFEGIQCICQRTGESRVSLVVTNPSLRTYFFDKFGCAPAVSFSVDSDAKEFLSSLQWSPAEGGADSIASRADRFVLRGEQHHWLMVAERDPELCRLFVERGMEGAALEKCLQGAWCYSPQEIESHLRDRGVDATHAMRVARGIEVAYRGPRIR